MADLDDEWTPVYEKVTPLYIGPLPHNVRRMLQALDAYWLHCDGLPEHKLRSVRGKYDTEDWWIRFEKYRAKIAHTSERFAELGGER